jgi:hypothetical protein
MQMAHEKSQRSNHFHLYNRVYKAWIQAQINCVSSGFGHVVTACLTRASLTNRLPARCFLSDSMKCKPTRREIGIVVHNLPAVAPQPVTCLGSNMAPGVVTQNDDALVQQPRPFASNGSP